MSGFSISPQLCIVYRVEILQSCTTGHVIPLSCTISIGYQSRYCCLIYVMSLIIQIRVQYLTDHIIKLNMMEMKSLRSWTEIDWTWQPLFTDYLSKSRARRVCCEQLFDCRKTFVARIFKIQVWRATSAHKYGCPTVILGNSGQSGQWSC